MNRRQRVRPYVEDMHSPDVSGGGTIVAEGGTADTARHRSPSAYLNGFPGSYAAVMKAVKACRPHSSQ
ncbi:hypothetical protein Aut01nite_67420 [Actinoplanes utahensis]|nr:hypothetical protein Aut01nite_67420 [Actinoplanes utahensis]